MQNSIPVELRIIISINVTVQGQECTQQLNVPVAVPSASIIQPPQQQIIIPKQEAATTLPALYQRLLSERDEENQVSTKTIHSNHSVLRQFEKWCEKKYSVQSGQCASLLSQSNILKEYAGHLRSQSKGNSASMCQKALATIIKLATACVKAGIISTRPDGVQKTYINILKPRTEEQRRLKAVPVKLNELRAMLAVVDGCKWPRIGKVSPAIFWETCLLSHFAYGFRSQDWFVSRCNVKKGLLWSGVLSDSKCPVIDDLHNAAGWVWYLVNKTAKKDEAAGRPSDVLVPLSSRMRNLLEKFRGVDATRVFPLPNNSRTYSSEFCRLLKRAGLSDKERIESGKPIIRLSLGQRNVASFRKSCSIEWAKHVDRSASSYLLHHAIVEEKVSKMTTDCYLQDEDILRKIVSGIETLPVWQVI